MWQWLFLVFKSHILTHLLSQLHTQYSIYSFQFKYGLNGSTSWVNDFVRFQSDFVLNASQSEKSFLYSWLYIHKEHKITFVISNVLHKVILCLLVYVYI